MRARSQVTRGYFLWKPICLWIVGEKTVVEMLKVNYQKVFIVYLNDLIVNDYFGNALSSNPKHSTIK